MAGRGRFRDQAGARPSEEEGLKHNSNFAPRACNNIWLNVRCSAVLAVFERIAGGRWGLIFPGL